MRQEVKLKPHGTLISGVGSTLCVLLVQDVRNIELIIGIFSRNPHQINVEICEPKDQSCPLTCPDMNATTRDLHS